MTLKRKRDEEESQQRRLLQPYKRQKQDLEAKQHLEKQQMKKRHQEERDGLDETRPDVPETDGKTPKSDMLDLLDCVLDDKTESGMLVYKHHPGMSVIMAALSNESSPMEVDTKTADQIADAIRSRVRAFAIAIRVKVTGDLKGYKGREAIWNTDDVNIDDGTVYYNNKQTTVPTTEDAVYHESYWRDALEGLDPDSDDINYGHHYPSAATAYIYIPGYYLALGSGELPVEFK